MVCRRPVLSHPAGGAYGVLDCGLAFAGKTGLESGLGGIYNARNDPPVWLLGRHHFERDYRSYFSPVVAEAQLSQPGFPRFQWKAALIRLLSTITTISLLG